MTRTQREQRTQSAKAQSAEVLSAAPPRLRSAALVAVGVLLSSYGLLESSAGAAALRPATSAPSASSSALGSIRGRVDARRPPAVAPRRPTVAALGAPVDTVRTDPARSVVYLESAPRGAFEQVEPGRAVMDQRNETFVPHVLAVTAGTVVEFPNSDRIYHNVFSLSKGARFDLGRYETGHSKSVRFDRPGVVRVFCEIHSHMNAFVLVFGHPFFAMTDIDGRYRIDNVPPGTYSLVAWNEGVSSEPRPVTVPDGGATEIDLAVR
jgi:plastocyanin